MKITRLILRRSGFLAAGIAGVLVVTGCPSEDPINNILAPGTGGEIVANFVVTSGGGFGVPIGAIAHNSFRLAFAAPGELDALGKATGRLEYLGASSTQESACGTTGEGVYSYADAARTSLNDPRLPALQATNVEFDTWAGSPLAVNIGPVCQGGPFWNIWSSYTSGLPPNKTFVSGLVRYVTEVRGEADAAQILLGGTVDEPDSLYPMPFQPGGTKDWPANFTCCSSLFGDANPSILGFFTSNANGGATSDNILIDDLGPYWWTNTNQAVADSAPYPVNSPTAFNLPQYNYYVIWEADPVTHEPDYTKPAIRYQLGPDLLPDGSILAEGFAPFPTAPLSAADLATVKGVLHPTGSTVTVTGLQPLSGSYVYKMWLRNLLTNDVIAAPGSLVETDPDGNTVSSGTASSFNPASTANTLTATITRAGLAQGMPNFTHFIISQEADAGAASPSQKQFIFRQYIDRNGTNDDFSDDAASAGPMTIGVPAANIDGFARRWGLAGDGFGHIFGDEFRSRVEQLARPPVGFFYRGWLVDAGGGYHDLGPLTVDDPPTYTALRDADVSREIPSAANSVVTATFIARGINRALLADIPTLTAQGEEHPLCNVLSYWVTLELKEGADATSPSPIVALTGDAPETFLTSPICRP